jgi:hypothetical protein
VASFVKRSNGKWAYVVSRASARRRSSVTDTTSRRTSYARKIAGLGADDEVAKAVPGDREAVLLGREVAGRLPLDPVSLVVFVRIDDGLDEPAEVGMA